MSGDQRVDPRAEAGAGAGVGRRIGYCGGLCQVLPPDIVNRIIERGTPRQRERALRTLAIDHSLRSGRVGRASEVESGPQLIAAASSPAAVKRVTVYDAENTQRLPGRRVRGEQDPPTGDIAVDEAWQYLTDTWQFLLEAYGRDSIDGQGKALNGSVHYGEDYANAFWDGRRMVFGDGDGELFERFTISVDVVGHELAHGMTDSESGLIYWAQAGALNESLSDVFGSMVKQYVLDEKADQADWLIGEGLFTSAVNGVALRSMKAPGTAYDDAVLGKDPQPGDMSGYVRGIEDNGGVHTNSGIPNRAFYLAAVNIGGYSWEGAGQIWYATATSPLLRRTTQFRTFAMLTCLQASRIFPGTDAVEAVRDAWEQVGLKVTP
jgi:Zn-dependent metalloprotease